MEDNNLPQTEFDPITGETITPEEVFEEQVTETFNNFEDVDREAVQSKDVVEKRMNFEKTAQENNEEFAAKLPKELPIGLKESLANFPEKMKMPVLCGIMPLCMSYASDLRFKYCDGKYQRLNLMSIIYGRQASGKSNVREIVDIWKGPMKWQDTIGREEEDAYKAKKRSRKANEKLPEEPKPIIREVPITISCSTLLKRLKNSQGKHLYSFGEELGTLQKTNGAGSWSSKYDIYRLSFDNGSWGQDYCATDSESGVVDVAYNWSVLGTLGAVEKCFKADSIENGMCGRVLFAQMPSQFFEHMPQYHERRPINGDKIIEAVDILSSASGEIDLPPLSKAIREWCDAKADVAAQNNDMAMDTLRKRAAVIGMRCGIIYHLLQQRETVSRSCIQFAEVMAEYTLVNQMEIFGQQMNEIMSKTSENKETLMTKNNMLFEDLPEVFTKEDMQERRQDQSDAARRNCVRYWISRGMCIKIKKNTWRKTPKASKSISDD